MTAKEEARELYLRWLEPQLRDDHAPTKSYWDLINVMFDKPFVDHVPYDDNRIADGLELRSEFKHVGHIRQNVLDRLGPCSFLEVHIGLSRRMAFTAGGEAPEWSWDLLRNLDLHRFPDPLSGRKQTKAKEIMDAVIWRRYAPDGQGGFFPLLQADEDQTQIELWYQLNAYVEEIHLNHPGY